MEEQIATPAAKRKVLIRRLVLWGVIIASVWAFLWFVLPERAGDAAVEAEMRATDALRQVNGALAEFETASGRYPNSLDALAGNSFAQAREAAQRAQALGYRLEYSPGPPEGGRVRTYTLLARPGNFGYRNFYTNETGTIRATGENRAATAQDQPI
ncbi:MAG: hypothetical protein ACRD5F_09700 [Candidatus Acidiferrales bacterium]